MIRQKVVLYLRLSQEDGDGESGSITNQRKILTEYASNNNMEIVDIYIDDGESGYIMERPEFNRLKRDLNDDKIDIILVKDLSRLGRHSPNVQTFLDNIIKAGKRLIAIGDNYDTLDEDTHDMVGIKTWMDERYVKETSKKIRRTLAILQKEGKLLSNVPYGYYKDERDKNKCHIDQNVAPYIQQIFDLYINGYGVKHIARILSETNVPTPTMVKKQRQEDRGQVSKIKVSGVWDTSVLIKILKNEFYLGTLVLNKTKTRSIRGKAVSTPKNEQLKFPGHHEAIIDQQTFKLAQEIRVGRQSTHFRGKKSKVRKNLFSGIIFCADCGSILTTSGYTANTRYICKTYNVFGTAKCTNHVIMENDILEAIFNLLEHCKKNLGDIVEDLNNIIQSELKVKGDKKDNSFELLQRLERAKNMLEILIDQKVKEMIKSPNMADIIDNTYSTMINEKYKEIQTIEKQIDDNKNFSISESKIKNDLNIAISTMNDILNSKDITKKQILMIVEKIRVYKDGGLDIFLKGNLHELSSNYFEVSDKKMNLIKQHMFDYIAANPSRITKEECTVYVKDKGIKTSYKTISKIINEELIHLVAFRPMRQGYYLTGDITEVQRILLGNIVVGTAECLYHNNVKNGKRVTQVDNVIGGANYLRSNNNKIILLTKISDWVHTFIDTKKKLF